MAPRRVGADQHQQIGLVEIFVAARHGVGAEGAAMAGDRGRHAQPRIGIDIGAADESLHQLVGDVIVLGQQLAGQIECDRARTVARDDVRRAMRDMVERVGPGHPLHARPCCSGSSDRAGAAQGRAFRRAPSLSSTAVRNWRDVPDRPISPRRRCRPASPTRRSRRRNRDRSCAWRARAGSTIVMENRSSCRLRPDRDRAAEHHVAANRRDRLAAADQFEIPERVSTSPTSTAPVSRPSEITSFL